MIEKRIRYLEGGNGERPGIKYLNGNVIDLRPYLKDRWWEIETSAPDDDETKLSREGIISHLAQMTDNELRELYGGYLVPYGYKEEDIIKMPMKELEYLFKQVMNI